MKEYTVDIRYDKNIVTDQYKVDLCDNIHINEITNMMTIMESTKYSNNIDFNLGRARNIGEHLRGS
jgi:hypothetical protein